MKLPAFFEEDRQAVDAALERLLPPEETRPFIIHRAMRYSVFAGGKRLRPIFFGEAELDCRGNLGVRRRRRIPVQLHPLRLDYWGRRGLALRLAAGQKCVNRLRHRTSQGDRGADGVGDARVQLADFQVRAGRRLGSKFTYRNAAFSVAFDGELRCLLQTHGEEDGGMIAANRGEGYVSPDRRTTFDLHP